MTRIAFSTVACPTWGLSRVASAAAELGYDGVELRTFGFGPTDFVCDPATTDTGKIRRVFAERGVSICCLASSLRFDDPITPPVIGRVISDTERAVREARSLIDYAVQVECPMVRVFAHEILAGSRQVALGLIVSRLRMVADHADKTGVTVVVENGGDFRTSHDLVEIMGQVGSPLLLASYSAREAIGAHESTAAGVRALGARLGVFKVQHEYSHAGSHGGSHSGSHDEQPHGDSHKEDGVRIGELLGLDGVHALDGRAWVVFEYDKAWIPTLPEPEAPLREACAQIRRASMSPMTPALRA